MVILNQAVFGLDLKQRDLICQESLNVHNLFMDRKKVLPYQKLLLSATLTHNPEILEQVDLFKPIYFNVAVEKLKNTGEKTTKTTSNEANKTVDQNGI